jgi:DNA adenine methylase
LIDADYYEPYSGGAGAALHLLFRGYASQVHLNDIDPGIYAFWTAVLTEAERFASMIESVPLTIPEWKRQRAILGQEGASVLDRGFACFYLNRTNRSGILNAGVIGGKAQAGKWKIDARFNRMELSRRVREIGRLRGQIHVTCLDALEFLDIIPKKRRAFCYLDPPYYLKGQALYTNFYRPEDHAQIAAQLGRLQCPWLLTYDDCDEIRLLYKDYRILTSRISYSARVARRGTELVVMSNDIKIPKAPATVRRRHAPGFEIVQYL